MSLLVCRVGHLVERVHVGDIQCIWGCRGGRLCLCCESRFGRGNDLFGELEDVPEGDGGGIAAEEEFGREGA